MGKEMRRKFGSGYLMEWWRASEGPTWQHENGSWRSSSTFKANAITKEIVTEGRMIYNIDS
jgi:hypothetical protein